MRRSEPTNPGGMLVSEAKKRRLQGTSSAPPAPQPPQSAAAPTSRHTITASATVSDAAAAGTGSLSASVTLYATLDASILDGPLSRAFQPAAAVAPAASGPGRPTAQQSTSGTAPERTIEQLLQQLMDTNPRMGASQAQRSTVGLRLQDKTLLLDNPISTISARQAFGKKACTTFSAKLLSGKQLKRKLGSLKDHPPTFAALQQLHTLWAKYISQLLSLSPGPEQHGAVLLNADFHGSLLTVVSCKNVQLVGVTGIVCRVSSTTLTMVSANDRMHVLPKLGCTFQYRISGTDMQVTLKGDGMPWPGANTKKPKRS
ncbi:MAG: hypothetical protein WDW38_001457 [Sanguina aurantia]